MTQNLSVFTQCALVCINGIRCSEFGPRLCTPNQIRFFLFPKSNAYQKWQGVSNFPNSSITLHYFRKINCIIKTFMHQCAVKKCLLAISGGLKNILALFGNVFSENCKIVEQCQQCCCLQGPDPISNVHFYRRCQALFDIAKSVFGKEPTLMD